MITLHTYKARDYKTDEMTIIRGISLENDVQDLELNIADQTGLNGSSVFRQNSLLDFGALPDFSNLLTPNIKTQPFEFEESMYQDSSVKDDTKSTMQGFQIENIKTEEVSPTLSQSELTSFIAAVTEATTNQLSTQTMSFSSMPEIKQEPLDLQTENQKVTIRNDGSIEMTTYTSAQDVSLMTSGTDAALQQLQAKIQKASRELGIPRNPWLWSVDQVNRWVHWLFTTNYDMEPTFSLCLDGTKLCMAKDLQLFVNGQEGAAEIISIEIDLWKQAFNIETEVLAAQQQQRYIQLQQQQQAYVSSEDPKVYFDLSNSRPVTSQVPQSTNSSVSVIPTPIPTHSVNAMSMTLNEIHQQMQFEYSHGNRSSFPSHLQQVSPTSSTNSSQGWDSPRSCESGFASGSTDYTSMDEDTRDCSPAPSIATPVVRGSLPPTRNSIKLWQFLRGLLEQPGLTCIRWVDREKGIFKIEDSQKVAKMWGQRKNRPAMNYDKLSRSIRQYYKKKIIKKTDNSKRLVYQFCAPYL